MMRALQGLLIAGVLSLATSAHAGGVSGENFDWLYVRPFVGYEVAVIGSAATNGTTGETTLHGLAFGGEAGVRLGPFSFGALYQRTEALDDVNKGANLNKLYGLFNLNLRQGFMNGVVTLGFGWANIGVPNASVNGFGGKIGAALDFYPFDWMSIGPGASFDLQGYSVPNALIGGYGGTFVARVGFYL